MKNCVLSTYQGHKEKKSLGTEKKSLVKITEYKELHNFRDL